MYVPVAGAPFTGSSRCVEERDQNLQKSTRGRKHRAIRDHRDRQKKGKEVHVLA